MPRIATTLDRREFLRVGAAGLLTFLCGGLTACKGRTVGGGSITDLGPLQPPDANGVMLPPGFTSRIVARSSQIPAAGGYTWHSAPDGGATFSTPGGGWIYVSNSEMDSGTGGVGALVFDSTGSLIDSYSICSGTSRNCAGGKTPWNTWLTCEENGAAGQVYECDPFGVNSPVVHPAMGSFNHEAVAVDESRQQLFLTEDHPSGGFYRYTPTTWHDLSAGLLEIAEVTLVTPDEGLVTWHAIADPDGNPTATRSQVGVSAAFNGGEGVAVYGDLVYFVTKGDNKVWRYNAVTHALTLLYDKATSPTPILSGVDNIVISNSGDVIVAEDGGDLEIVGLSPEGDVVSVLKLSGHGSSEITGPAFDPTYERMYFSSQRGTTGNSADGITFEITGPFNF
ncbi:MAG: alkaline phosphatase PhoX [Planctomycetota bacterium]